MFGTNVFIKTTSFLLDVMVYCMGQCYNLVHQMPTDNYLLSNFYAPVELLGKALYDFFSNNS